MKITDYISYFTPDDSIRFYLETDKGKVINFVVQYETFVDDEWKPVVRYDTAHGFPHKDVLNRRNRIIEKTDLRHMRYKDALEFAVSDISLNWEDYKKQFLKRRRR